MKTSARLTLLSFFLAGGLLAFAEPASAEIITVKQGGGGDFAQIQAAINVAVDGDIILVYPGSQPYGDFSVNGKALVITSQGSLVQVGEAKIKNVPLSGYLGLKGFRIQGLELSNNQGTVGAFDCTIHEGFNVSTSADVQIVGCTMKGYAGGSDGCDGFSGGSGLLLNKSHAAVYNSSATGGNGGNAGSCFLSSGGNGGSGIAVIDEGYLFVSQSEVQGGIGGCGGSGSDGIGGTGLYASFSSAAFVLDSSLNGGPGACGPGGSDWLGNLSFLTGTAPELEVLSPLIVQGKAHLRVTGSPGDDVFILSGKTQFKESINNLRGIRHVKDNVGSYVGVIPATGVLQVDLPVAGPTDLFYFQALTMTPNHVRTLSNPVPPVYQR